jgi:type IV pilus assembly protein PilX
VIAVKAQRGMVLVTSLLLLLVVTMLAISMFRSMGLDEKIAGNMRDKQRALNAAETAEQYAENWLSQGNGSNGINCTTLVNANVNPPQVCSNTLQSSVPGNNVAALPWMIGGAPVGVNYLPAVISNMNVATSSNPDYYSGTPIFYIAYIGTSPGGLGSIYQIDAAGFGGTANTAAVVESTFLVQSSVKDLGGL